MDFQRDQKWFVTVFVAAIASLFLCITFLPAAFLFALAWIVYMFFGDAGWYIVAMPGVVWSVGCILFGIYFIFREFF